MSPRNILLVVSLLLSIAIGTVLGRGGDTAGAASGAGSRERAVVIGLSMDTLKEARWQVDRDVFVERARELGATVSVQSANSDDTVQVRDCESLLANHVDTLVIVPHDGLAMAKAVDKAKALHVPVIAYDRMIASPDIDIYTSFDNVEVGRQQARFLVERLHGKGKVVRIYGAPTDNNARLFKQGQDEILKPYVDRGDIVVVHEDWAEDWKPENAKRITSAAITKNRKFDGLLASNDGTAGGAIQALYEEKITGVIVTGQDAELPACQRIAAGSQTMTIYKPVERLARGAADLAVALARREVVVANGRVHNGKRAIPSVLYETVTVTRDNLVDTVVRDRFHTYDDLFRGVPEGQRPPRP